VEVDLLITLRGVECPTIPETRFHWRPTQPLYCIAGFKINKDYTAVQSRRRDNNNKQQVWKDKREKLLRREQRKRQSGTSVFVEFLDLRDGQFSGVLFYPADVFSRKFGSCAGSLLKIFWVLA
jgi:hypothetical protein